MELQLNAGAIMAIFTQQEGVGQPLLQVIDIKHLPSAGGGGRYRLIVSDSQHYQQAMLATQLNDLVTGGAITPFCIIQLTESIVNLVSGRRVVIVLGLNVVDPGPGCQIGEPINAETSLMPSQGGFPAPAVAQPPPQQHQQPHQPPQPVYQQQHQAMPAQHHQPQIPQHQQHQPQPQHQQQAQHQQVPQHQQQPQYHQQPQQHQQHQPQNQQWGHAQPAAQPWQQQQRSFNHEFDDGGVAPAPVARSRNAFGEEGDIPFQPIASLNPYTNRWVIKARVTAKTDMKTWNNTRSDGKLFSVELLDAAGGQIRATMFNEAADKFFQVFQLNQVYLVTKGNLKLANKTFSSVPNEYELTLNADAEVKFVGADDTIEHQRFDFVPIDRIPFCKPNEMVDVVGIVKTIQPISTVLSSKTKQQLLKRNVMLADTSLLSVELTFWGESAEKFNEELLGQVIAVKACKISDYNGGRSLGSSWGSRVYVNPDKPEAHTLRAWFDNQGRNAMLTCISKGGGGPGSDRKITFQQIKDENLGNSPDNKPDYFLVKATVTFFRHEMEKPPWYPACPTAECNKKVVQDPSGMWACEKCQKQYPNATPRYILSLMACDSTGSQWLTAFNDQAQQMLGRSALEMVELVNQQNDKAFEAVFQEANFKSYLFKCRAKQEKRDDESKVRLHIQNVTPINYRQESAALLDQIAAYC